jgi:hypothetical protein
MAIEEKGKLTLEDNIFECNPKNINRKFWDFA